MAWGQKPDDARASDSDAIGKAAGLAPLHALAHDLGRREVLDGAWRGRLLRLGLRHRGRRTMTREKNMIWPEDMWVGSDSWVDNCSVAFGQYSTGLDQLRFGIDPTQSGSANVGLRSTKFGVSPNMAIADPSSRRHARPHVGNTGPAWPRLAYTRVESGCSCETVTPNLLRGAMFM